MQDVDLILFEVGGRKWAADPWDVVRVDRASGESSARALVVRGSEGETPVPIDRLLGFQRVPAQALRALPPFAQTLTSPAVIGAWLAPEDSRSEGSAAPGEVGVKEIVLLLDLQALVKESVSLC
ncbi:MAG: hypothetical protein QM765_01570 [Myxococcales bacterium]